MKKQPQSLDEVFLLRKYKEILKFYRKDCQSVFKNCKRTEQLFHKRVYFTGNKLMKKLDFIRYQVNAS